jgi:dUTP pyrophosphatase
MTDNVRSILIEKRDERAVIPELAHKTDVGYDLVCIGVVKAVSTGVLIYDTGIAVKAPEGYHIEIVPRSSISNSGWFLANSIGIIDQEYTGNLLVALAPYNIETSESLQTPFCLCQFIIRKTNRFPIQVVNSIDQTTDRGDGAFGSTGQRID